jgi:hypothetical protein
MQGPLNVSALLVPKRHPVPKLVNGSHIDDIPVLTVRGVSQIIDEPHLVIIGIGAKAASLQAIQAFLELLPFLRSVVFVIAYDVPLVCP